jgi:hypothetical protein
MFRNTLLVIMGLFLNMICSLAYAQNVGISHTSFSPHYRVQKTLTWCWASSAEMVLSYEGVKIPQDAIVTKVKGAPIPGTGNPYEMIGATNGVFKDATGASVVVSGQFVIGPPPPTVLYNQLKHNRPVVLTYQNGPWSGHAVVLTGVDATVNSSGVQISRFYIFDPFPFVQQHTPWGPKLVHVPALEYQQLDLIQTPMGVQLTRQGMPIGILSGMILMDASK